MKLCVKAYLSSLETGHTGKIGDQSVAAIVASAALLDETLTERSSEKVLKVNK